MTLPEGTVRCRPGDHLLRQRGDDWVLALMHDYVRVTRLVALMRDEVPVDLVDESPEGVAPRYDGPHLWLTEWRFARREDALAALRDGTPGAGVEGVCRPLADFPAATTDVIAG
jgi:hypothetical protein